MPPTAKAAKSFDTALVLPALVVFILYAAFLVLWGLPGSADLKAKERALADAKAAAVSPQEVGRLQQQQTELKQKMEDVGKQLALHCREAEGLARKQSQPLGRIEVVSQIEDLLKRHGLEVTKVKAASDQTDSKLAASLQRAAGGLVSALAKARPDKSASQLPPGVVLEEQAEAARLGIASSQSAVANAPPLDLREMELRGDYHDMLTALQALASAGGDSVVVSVGFERPEATTAKNRVPLSWRLVLHVQPDSRGNQSPSHPTMPAEIPRLAAGDRGSGVGDREAGGALAPFPTPRTPNTTPAALSPLPTPDP